MRLRNPADWTPSRMNLSVFRLVGYFLLVRRQPRPSGENRSHLLHFERHQNAFEAYALAFGSFVFCLAFLSGLFAHAFHWSPSVTLLFIPLLAPVNLLLMQVLAFLIGLPISAIHSLSGSETWNPRRLAGWAHGILYTLVAYVLIGYGSWWSWIGGLWFSLLGLNLVAAALARLLRTRIETVSLRFEESSGTAG